MSSAMLLAFLEKQWMLVLVFVASGLMLLWPLVQRRFSSVKELGTHELTRLMNDRNPVLLDVREQKELDGAKLTNAVHIPLSELGKRGSELSSMTSRPLVAYCARGNRTSGAARLLANLGFQEIYALRGGIAAWRAAGLPVAR